MAEVKLKHAWLRALGGDDMPASIDLADGRYVHLRTYKHDFFAATGLYEGPSGRVILKLGRTARMIGLPMAWLGAWLTGHELAVYRRLDGVEGVPRCFGRWGRTGLVHLFVEGHPLQRQERVDDDFFPRLRTLLDELHRRCVAYVDLEKRENILVDSDGRPALIDFQISWWWAPDEPGGRYGIGWLVPGFLGRFVLARLQRADLYHLAKHCRRHRPDLMTAEDLAASYRHGPLIAIHRVVSWPFTAMRRKILRWLTGRSRSPKQDGPEFLEPVEGLKRK